MKLFFTLKDLVKYVIFIFIVYTILKLVPSQQIFSKDIFLIICVVFSSFILVDNLYQNKYFLSIVNNINSVSETIENFEIEIKQSKIPAKESAPED